MAKTIPINMRAEPEQQSLLTKAAKLLHIDRSTFILNAACREAEDVLIDQRTFSLNEANFNKFTKLLEQPVDCEALSRLMKEKAPWD